VDALMVGKKSTGSNVLILIEWKYTEEYREENKYIPARYEIYNKLLDEEGCPIIDSQHSALYYEPFYQLMRQTLLGWKMVKNREYQCDELLHLHVIPSGNVELRDRVTSPDLRSKGSNMSEAWKSVLKEPNRYIVITSEDFLKPALDCEDTHSIVAYLKKRYWSSKSFHSDRSHPADSDDVGAKEIE